MKIILQNDWNDFIVYYKFYYANFIGSVIYISLVFIILIENVVDESVFNSNCCN